MLKSRFRFWLSLAFMTGLITAFFKIGTQSDQRERNLSIPHNGIANHDSLYPFSSTSESHQATQEHTLTSFFNSTAQDSSVFTEPLRRIDAQQAWEWSNAGNAVLLDLRSYDDYQIYHPVGAQSFSLARLADLEATFPRKTLIYILMDWGNPDLTVVSRVFRQRGYHQLCVLEMNSARPGLYKMNEWEQRQLPVARKNVFNIGNIEIKLEKYAVKSDSLGNTKTLAAFPQPSVKRLLQYRPQILGQFGYDEGNEEFRDALGEIASVISAATLADNKIWVGFSFYEGEGNTGYGGIGFYDLQTGAIGVLRHPAFVNHSVRDLMITDAMIYVATIDEFELSREVGNGLVLIDRKTLQVRALAPPGTTIVWHKDGGENAALFYDKSIPEMLADRRLIPQNVEGWNPNDLLTALNLGLERYMIQNAEHEFQSVVSF